MGDEVQNKHERVELHPFPIPNSYVKVLIPRATGRTIFENRIFKEVITGK